MNRYHNKTVTGFALLLPASALEAVGEATFASEAFGPSHVRPVTLDELRATAKKLRGEDAARFGALLALRDALESGDQLALDRARERMERLYRFRQTEQPKTADQSGVDQLGAVFAPRTGLPPTETAKYMLGMRSGPKANENPIRLFSYEVSEAVGSLFAAQVVLWWVNGAFRPAIYCLDINTALYIHTFFLAPVGGLSFRICPYDGEQFFQDRPNQEYCCPAHREAHRVARFRDNKRRKEAERGKEGRKHGTKKTR